MIPILTKKQNKNKNKYNKNNTSTLAKSSTWLFYAYQLTTDKNLCYHLKVIHSEELCMNIDLNVFGWDVSTFVDQQPTNKNEIIENEHSSDLYDVLTMVGGFTIKRDS